jgi:putative Holliday junction resolvase
MPEPTVPLQGAAGRGIGAQRCFLSFDFSLRRVGVAVGNTLLAQAQPLRTLHEVGEPRLQAIAQVVSQWQPDALVVGVPRHPDGTPHENTARAQRFARQLQAKFKLPVHEVDERYTTVEAKRLGARDPDAVAAALILEQFLSSQGHAITA